MSSMNSIHLIGRVGGDPDYRRFQSGGELIEFSLATSERWRDRQSGDQREKTQWHRVKITNENLIKIAREYVKKGDLVGIEGKLEYRQWEKDGHKHTSAEVVLDFAGRLHLLGSASGGGSDNRGSSRRDDDRGSSQRRDDYGSGSRGGGRQGGSRNLQQDMDDDIPF